MNEPPEESPGGGPAGMLMTNGLPPGEEKGRIDGDSIAAPLKPNSSVVSGRTRPPSIRDNEERGEDSSTATHDSSPSTGEGNGQRQEPGKVAENEGGDDDTGDADDDDNNNADTEGGDRTTAAAEDSNNEEPSAKSSSSKAAKKPSILGRRPSSASPPKMRIKLSLRTLPTLANRKAIPNPKVAESQAMPEVNNRDDNGDDNNDEEDNDCSSSNTDGEGSVKAMVVDSDEGEEDEVVASVIVEDSSAALVGGEDGGGSGGAQRATTGGSSGNNATNKSSNNKSSPKQQQSGLPPKRRSQPGTRPIRMPPIASPALLMPQPTASTTASAGGAEKDSQLLPALLTISSMVNSKKAGAEGKAYVTPASVFDHSMEVAGYTVESRTARPHRGSSVKRQVGDMFDSDTALTLRFPSLIPRELMEKVIDGVPLPKLLIDSIQRKRRRRFAHMVPRSLTINYPEEYVQKRIEYVRQVEAREAAIVMYQESQEDGDADESVAIAAANGANEVVRTNGNIRVAIPPIPDPPSPPIIKELIDFPADFYKDQHPLYPPRFDNFASHLDPQAFHITEGRYFGLSTNYVADPNFVGPNAPGLTSVSTGAGLATSSAGGGGISGAMALTLATTFNGVTAGAASALKSSAAPSSNSVSTLHQKIKNDSDESTPAFVAGPKPTATSADLKKVMDQDDEHSSRMKRCIIRAAVHASRSGRHWQAFVGPNREIYPDISKAFAAHAGIKPCQRCKSNKQGVRWYLELYAPIRLGCHNVSVGSCLTTPFFLSQAYHCRLRRRHRQLDYDGGHSLAVIDPLFSAPMESLLERG